MNTVAVAVEMTTMTAILILVMDEGEKEWKVCVLRSIRASSRPSLDVAFVLLAWWCLRTEAEQLELVPLPETIEDDGKLTLH